MELVSNFEFQAQWNFNAVLRFLVFVSRVVLIRLKPVKYAKLMVLTTLLFWWLPGVMRSEQGAGQSITAGGGWGEVVLLGERSDVEKVLGRGDFSPKVGYGYYLDYPGKGLQVYCAESDNKVRSILFYNKARRFEHFAQFKAKTSTGIGWRSSIDQVIKAYGKPIENVTGKDSGGSWQRVVFKGIDFLYEDERMVRIRVSTEDKTAPVIKHGKKKPSKMF